MPLSHAMAARRICRPCIALGIAGALVSSAALASSEPGEPFVRWVLGLVLSLFAVTASALIAFYTRTVERRTAALEHGLKNQQQAHSTLRELVLTRSHEKADIDRMFDGVNDKLDQLLKAQQDIRLQFVQVSARHVHAAPLNPPRAHTGD